MKAAGFFYIMITHAQLLCLLHYDANSGVFTSKVAKGPLSVGKAVGSLNERGYLRTTINKEHYFLHRLAWFYVKREWPPMLDHKDGDFSNNRIKNLRLCNVVTNGRNRKRGANNTTGKTGVSFDSRDGIYFAAIKIEGKTVQLGRFNSFEAAKQARIKAEIARFGQFRRVGS